MTKTTKKSKQATTVKNMKNLIEENEKLSEKLKRSTADYQNLEKRIEAQRQVFTALALSSIFDKILASIDDFHIVDKHLNDKGLKMSLQKLEAVLRSEGLEEIEAKGLAFDPQTMDCIDTTDKISKDIVFEVKKKGYKFNGQIIRPAHVVVGTK